MKKQRCWYLDSVEQKHWWTLHSRVGKKIQHPFISVFFKSIQSRFSVFTHRWSRCGEWDDVSFSVTAEQSWAAKEVKRLHEGAEVRGDKQTPSFEKEENRRTSRELSPESAALVLSFSSFVYLPGHIFTVLTDYILHHDFLCHWKTRKIMRMWRFSWSLPNKHVLLHLENKCCWSISAALCSG